RSSDPETSGLHHDAPAEVRSRASRLRRRGFANGRAPDSGRCAPQRSEVQMRGFRVTAVAAFAALIGAIAGFRLPAHLTAQQRAAANPHDIDVQQYSTKMIDEGRRIFRYETFDDETFWAGSLKLQRAIAGAKLGGVGPDVSPKTALSVGLKVDADALPPEVADALKAGKV